MAWFSTDFASQLGHFREVDSAHFDWQTDGGYFSKTEESLLSLGALPKAEAVLEIGCGEGGNLVHLGAREGWVGLDFASQKLAHAKARLPEVDFVVGDAMNLPFRDALFGGVLIRDVLHHVSSRDNVIAEAARVLKPGGVVAVIEPNRYNPMIIAQALAIKAERAVLRSTASRMRSELTRAGLRNVSVSHAQPLPIGRILLHPRLGTSTWGKSPSVAAALSAIDRVARRLVAPSVWMYLVGRAEKPA